MRKKEVINLLIRYGILILLGLGNLFLFYSVFTFLTVYPVYLLLNLIYGADIINGSIIFFNNIYANIIPACVAGSAYYLLFILNLTTPMNLDKRVRSLVFLFFSFLVLNIIRIFVFAILFSSGFAYFDFAHKAVWYFGSTIMVVGLWFFNVKLFKIKEIPIYSDFRNIFKHIKS